MGRKKTGDIVIGYWYKLGLQIAVCHGQVDEVQEIYVGENSAWRGQQNRTGSIYIDRLDLFGGDRKEGGVQGNVTMYFGEPTQPADPYVLKFHGNEGTPAQRGLLSMVFGSAIQQKTDVVVDNIDWNKSYFNRAALREIGYEDNPAIPYHPHIPPALEAMCKPDVEIQPGSAIKTLAVLNNHEKEDVGEFQAKNLIQPFAQGNNWRPGLMRAIFLLGTGQDGGSNWQVKKRVTADQLFAHREATKEAQAKEVRGTPFTWSAMNPQLKSLWVRVQCIRKGWGDGNQEAWYPQKAAIESTGAIDMNPAHIIYKTLTSTAWGMGYNALDIDDASFRAAADQLFDEKFGLSLKWTQESKIEDFVNLILKHIDANLSLDPISGKFKLTLIRATKNPASLPLLDENNVSSIDSFERAAWGDTPNELVVTYTDRNENKATVAVQNMAAIHAQGGRISSTVEYVGIRTPDLAARVGERDLRVSSTPLAKVTLKVNRIAWPMLVGDCFRLSWAAYGMRDVVFRILTMSAGTYGNGEIQITAIEDVFTMPDSTYLLPQKPKWQDPLNTEVPHVDDAMAWEASYYDLAQVLGDDDAKKEADKGSAFGLFAAAQPSAMSSTYNLYNGNNQALGSYLYVPSFALTWPIKKTDTTISVSYIDGDVASIDGTQDYIVIGSEAMSIQSIDTRNNKIWVGRGVLDTVPQDLGAGARGFIVRPQNAADRTEYVKNQRVTYKPVAVALQGTQKLTTAKTFPLTFAGRAQAPWPPVVVFESKGVFPDSWPKGKVLRFYGNFRNRLLQTAGFTSYFDSNVSYEPNTKYPWRILDKDGNVMWQSELFLSRDWYNMPISPFPIKDLTGQSTQFICPCEEMVGSSKIKMSYGNEPRFFTTASPAPKLITITDGETYGGKTKAVQWTNASRLRWVQTAFMAADNSVPPEFYMQGGIVMMSLRIDEPDSETGIKDLFYHGNGQRENLSMTWNGANDTLTATFRGMTFSLPNVKRRVFNHIVFMYDSGGKASLWCNWSKITKDTGAIRTDTFVFDTKTGMVIGFNGLDNTIIDATKKARIPNLTMAEFRFYYNYHDEGWVMCMANGMPLTEKFTFEAWAERDGIQSLQRYKHTIEIV